MYYCTVVPHLKRPGAYSPPRRTDLLQKLLDGQVSEAQGARRVAAALCPLSFCPLIPVFCPLTSAPLPSVIYRAATRLSTIWMRAFSSSTSKGLVM